MTTKIIINILLIEEFIKIIIHIYYHFNCLMKSNINVKRWVFNSYISQVILIILPVVGEIKLYKLINKEYKIIAEFENDYFKNKKEFFEKIKNYNKNEKKESKTNRYKYIVKKFFTNEIRINMEINRILTEKLNDYIALNEISLVNINQMEQSIKYFLEKKENFKELKYTNAYLDIQFMSYKVKIDSRTNRIKLIRINYFGNINNVLEIIDIIETEGIKSTLIEAMIENLEKMDNLRNIRLDYRKDRIKNMHKAFYEKLLKESNDEKYFYSNIYK